MYVCVFTRDVCVCGFVWSREDIKSRKVTVGVFIEEGKSLIGVIKRYDVKMKINKCIVMLMKLKFLKSIE